MMLKGLFTAVVTPFHKNDQLDEEGFRQNLRFQLKHGVDGILVLGSTGESPTLDAEEKKRIIKISVEEIKGNALLLVGTGSYSTKQAIQNTLQAQELGADAALVINPYYNKPTQEGLFLHYASLCKSTSLPICIYNHPGRTGINLQTETMKKIAAFPTIIGVKDSNGILQMNEYLEAISPRFPHFSILTGDDITTLPILALGCHGVISVVSNLVPAPVKKLVEAGLRGDFVEARKWHYKLMPLYHAAFIESNPIPIKAAMNFCQMAAGHCRLPLCEMQPENLKKLYQVIQSLPSEWFDQESDLLAKQGELETSTSRL
jgi:4-hydroxy-tetrahydrodipicolinate synthase